MTGYELREDIMKKIILTVVCSIILTAFCSANSIKADETTVAPITGKTVFTYNENIGEKNTTLDVPVIPGINYEVTVTFTGRPEDEGRESVKPVRIYYEDVDADQCYANIQSPYEAQGVDDRSALLYEIPTIGVIDGRCFTVAAIDDSLRLIFVGDAKLIEVTVTPLEPKTAGEKRTIFVIGDSLVQTYNASSYPMNGWGQRLAEFFTDDVIVSNHAIGGRSTMNFIKQGRLNNVLINVRPGDYVFVTFGHNDAGSVAGRACTVDKYQSYLENWYIEGVRQRGGIPVMVTLGNQNIFGRNDGKIIASFPAYVAAMKQAAANTGCALIDLNAKSQERFQKIYYEKGALGMGDLVFHAFKPGIYENALTGAADGTHFQTYGAWLLASLVAEGVNEQKLEGIYEHYVGPVVYETVPEKVSDLKIDTKKFEEKYTHMDWNTSERAEYYVIERASLLADGTFEEFGILGYSPVTSYSDPDREEGATYCYRVYAVNNCGNSEESSDVLFYGNKEKELLDFLSKASTTSQNDGAEGSDPAGEGNEVGDVNGTGDNATSVGDGTSERDNSSTGDGTDSKDAAAAQDVNNKTTSIPFIIGTVSIAIIAAGAILQTVYYIKKKSK